MTRYFYHSLTMGVSKSVEVSDRVSVVMGPQKDFYDGP